MCQNTVDNARNGAWDHSTRIVHAISHGVTAAHLNGNGILLHQFIQFQTEGDHIAVDIRSCYILQMASGADSRLQAFTDHTQVMLHGLLSGHFHFIENMVVGTAHQDTCLLQTNVLYQFKILLAGTDPARNFREFISPLKTFIYCVSVLFAVKEKFALAYPAVWSAQFV